MTTPFLETPRFPDGLAFWAKGGPRWNTRIGINLAGVERRNQMWSAPLATYDVAPALMLRGTHASIANSATMIAYFNAVKGRTYGFRFKDFNDYNANVGGTGIISDLITATSNLGNGNGTPYLQLYKNYSAGTLTVQRPIYKPSTDVTFVAKKNGVTLTAGASAGNYALDTTLGKLTFVADSSKSITAVTVGATTVISATNHGFSNGNSIYLSGITGNAGAVLNNEAWTISAVNTNNFTVTANTVGLAGASGTAAKYPQPSDVMTWLGSFDVPVRFGTDELRGGPTGGMDAGDGSLYQWDSIPVNEIRIIAGE